MSATPQTFLNLPEEKRKRVLQEATKEFAEYGYHQASVNRIVGRLGIAKGSLFKYFGTKQGLFEHLFSNAVEHIKEPLNKIRTETAGQDLFDRLKKTMLAGLDFIEAHPRIYRIYLKMLLQENFPMREKILGSIRSESSDFLESMVRDAQDSGQVRKDLDTDSMVFFLESMVDRFFQSVTVPMLNGRGSLYQADRATIETRLEAVILIMKDGLGSTTHT